MSNKEIWNDRYCSDDYVYGTEPNDFLRSVSDQLPCGKTLCIAEGEGRNAVYLASKGHDVTAIDFSNVGLEKTRRLALRREVAVATQDADLIDFDFGIEEWDVIVSIFCHLDPVVRQRVHDRVVGGLVSGGVFVLEAYTPLQLQYGTGGPPRRELLVSLEDLKVELRPLRFLIGRELDRHIDEGRLHNGPSAVVQLLATKP